jgi:hypothetical protein
MILPDECRTLNITLLRTYSENTEWNLADVIQSMHIVIMCANNPFISLQSCRMLTIHNIKFLFFPHVSVFLGFFSYFININGLVHFIFIAQIRNITNNKLEIFQISYIGVVYLFCTYSKYVYHLYVASCTRLIVRLWLFL